MGQETMGTFTVKASCRELLKELEANKVTHEKEYLESVEIWERMVVESAEKELAKMQRILKAYQTKDFSDNGKAFRFYVEAPRSHVKSYTDAIGMLTMHQDEHIILSYEAFRMYVNDEWEWTERWKLSNSSLKGI